MKRENKWKNEREIFEIGVIEKTLEWEIEREIERR
jgi:hypothetical protein